jgi:CRP-like cAMP-binding protein
MLLPPITLDLLGRSDLFNGMLTAEIEAIVAQGHELTFDQGAFLFLEGEPADTIYLLLEGHVRLARLSPAGKQVIMHLFGPGEEMGVIAALSDIPYPADAEAVTAVRALSWPSAPMLELIHSYPRLAINALRLVTDRYVTLQGRYQTLATRRVEQRIAAELLRLAQAEAPQNGRSRSLSTPLARQDIADLISATLHTVSRICSAWEQAGIIQTRNRQIVICDPDALHAIIDEL